MRHGKIGSGSSDPKFRKDKRNPKNAGGRVPAPPAGGVEFSHLPGYWLYGQHALSAAMANPRRKILRRIAIDPSAAISSWDSRPLPAWERVEKALFDRLLGPGAIHQGFAARVLPLAESDVEDLIDQAEGRANAIILILDQVTDPQNVGAIMRSASAFGAIGLILTERNAAPESAALAKAASGALDHLPLIRVVNLARTIETLKAAGFWCAGLAAEGEKTLAEAKLTGRILLCLGAEGSGLRRLTRQSCDFLLRLPTLGPIAHLNVSNAAAIALYELNRDS